MGSKSAIGIGNGICFKQVRDKGGGSYIDPLVRDSIVGLWKFDQNTNESPTRNIIKNTIKDKGGDLELLNFAYKANSGYNGYPEDFTTYTYNAGNVIVKHDELSFNGNANTPTPIIYKFLNGNDSDLKEYTINFTKIGDAKVTYRYIDINGNLQELELIEGKNKLPYSYVSKLPIDNTTIWIGYKISKGNGCTITQLPLYEGALVTDGKDDMIVSQKTVQEMGITDKITVVSMIHKISTDNNWSNLIGELKEDHTFVANRATNTDKTGIYGYTYNYKNDANIINNILGDKNDYIVRTTTSLGLINKYYITGFENAGTITGVSQIAVYWTIIANKVLTTDEINQIIGYYKLDKYVTPQVIYDVKRQGLTNDTPAADWYLKDFSGNGHDMQLYNYAKSKNSGIGKYAEDFTTWNKYPNVVVTKDKIIVTDKFNQDWLVYKYSKSSSGISPMRIKITGIPINARIEYRYVKTSSDTAPSSFDILEDGIYDIPESFIINDAYSVGFKLSVGDYTHIEITQILDYEGALVSDGKNDYGKAEGLPILKDYTVAADYARLSYGNVDSAIISKSYAAGNGAFGFNLASGQSPNNVSAISFGTGSAKIQADDNYRKIRYQSKYVNDGVTINAGNGIDGNEMWLSCLRENYNFSESALYSMLLFPYSLSEFLLERQLKKYKLGTLYPNMVEFRPIVSGNIPYDKIEISQGSTVLYTGATDKTGIYLQEGSTVRVYIRPSGVDEVSKITINGIEYTDLPINVNGYYYADFPITKSPQKISYVIDEYIRFEDIVQPYPIIVNLSQDGKILTWGDKLKVGSEVVVTNYTILLPELYTHGGGIRYNGTTINLNAPIVVAKSMVFTNVHTWKLNTTEPHAIYSPQKLNIPNSSLKILGYIPDLTGKGNHGKLNNFAYTEDSGVAADGSVKFDGTDDHITIPTLAHGGKCVMMKVNWSNDGILYDQRPSGGHNTFGIYAGENHPAYSARNNGSTYIDGILNTNIIPSNLAGITHNITAVNDTATDNSTTYPILGTSFANAAFSDMSLYEFMLFPEIPSEDEIKKLNDVMGIEGGYIESPNYYWDAYGKKNTDTDRNLIADQVSKDVANALEVKNVGYNSESGYGYGKSNFISIMESSQQFVDIIDDYNFIIKATPHNNNQFFAQVNTPKLIPNNYIRFKVSGIPEDFKMVFGYDYVEGGTNEYSHIIDKNGVYSYDSFNMFYTSFRAYTGYTDLTGLNIKVEFLDYHPNGLLLDGVEDHAVNTIIPAVTDFTVIAKRTILDTPVNSAFCCKGEDYYTRAAFMLEFMSGSNEQVASFGTLASSVNLPDLITFMTATSYNGRVISKGTIEDTVGLWVGRYNAATFWKGVFYKAMLYSKTIDMLSINMLKNLFEKDELIDVNNPIFKKEEL